MSTIDSDPNNEMRWEVSPIRDQDEATPGITPSQTVGPYVHIGLTLEGSEQLVEPGTEGAIEVSFTVTDGGDTPISDAMIELWQANAEGIFNSPLDPRTAEKATAEGFRGLGRGMVDETGSVTFTTIRPGAHDEEESPHLKVGVFARGMLERLYTRLYFPDQDNSADPVLNAVPEERRGLLIAEPTERGFHLDIQVQHEDPNRETPFFGI
ncbi:Protocatechuate 3,4-dioxygenase alpha chain [Corynebacterium occultum]|uniref:Protocatechuate 3,4-dioxygenase alpha chain n=1 Tax=Corynebacterium occultum TaxID=2675219 RepID=A0A6B8W9W8_9CORY|nr:protocatechuate 3,4-dioxygenase subunit alpha [Corynebacterium occultum]QGU08065.1 Protocatechuate 3,4-dioxygenase alpha chain [Corynebacterium occultum]